MKTIAAAAVLKLQSSLVVQMAMTGAALAKDPLIAAWLDGLGAAFVGALMVVIGCKMVCSCLPDLLDCSVSEELEVTLDSILNEAGIGPAEIARCRTRRAGGLPHIELALTATRCVLVRDFLERAGKLEDRLRRRIPDADIAITVYTPGDPEDKPN